MEQVLLAVLAVGVLFRARHVLLTAMKAYHVCFLNRYTQTSRGYRYSAPRARLPLNAHP